MEKILLVSEALRTQLVTSSIPGAGFHIGTALAVPTLIKIDQQLHSPSVSQYLPTKQNYDGFSDYYA